jgi:hypothetical protein
VKRIYILCGSDAIFHGPLFHDILSRHAGNVVGAAVLPPLPAGRVWPSLQRVLRLDGPAGLWRLPARLAAHQWRARTQSPPHYASIRSVFARFGIPLRHEHRPNDPGFVEHLRDASPDVVFNNQPWLLNAPIPEVPRLASINRHTSLLPRYRGVEPVVHALLAGDTRIGVTYHTMTVEYDAGRILAQAEVPARRSVFDCYRDAFDVSGPLFDRALAALDDLEACPQIVPEDTEYYREPTIDEARAFRAKKLRYL